MRNKITFLHSIVAALVLSTGQLGAQAACGGAGAALGITSLQCDACSGVRHADGSMTWHFSAEPIVLKTVDGSALRSGDVIEAVDAFPISTPAGAERFVNPGPGAHHLTIRREDRQSVVDVNTAAGCASGRAAPVGSGAISPDSSTRVTGDTIDARATGARGSRYGFAISCSYCTRRAGEGVVYWTFTSPPTIAEVEPDSRAATAGLRVGDEILAVNGRPIVLKEESLVLNPIEQAATVRLAVKHAGGTRAIVEIVARDYQPR